jgi:protein TonB
LALVLASPYLTKLLREPTAVDNMTEVHNVRYTDLAPPPPIQNIPPPPRIHIPPPVKKAIKFIPPKVTDKEIVEIEKMPTIDEIKENDIGAETIEGTGEVVFEEPVSEVTGETAEEGDVIFTVLEQPAEFAGGIEALKRFLQENMVYPGVARRMGVEGSVYVTFVVDKVGAISDIQVMKGISSECDKEAIRVVGIMPPWKPGKQSGHAVKSRFVLPLKFTMGR